MAARPPAAEADVATAVGEVSLTGPHKHGGSKGLKLRLAQLTRELTNAKRERSDMDSAEMRAGVAPLPMNIYTLLSHCEVCKNERALQDLLASCPGPLKIRVLSVNDAEEVENAQGGREAMGLTAVHEDVDLAATCCNVCSKTNERGLRLIVMRGPGQMKITVASSEMSFARMIELVKKKQQVGICGNDGNGKVKAGRYVPPWSL
jgi:hypothetical protein